jgi:hypothetical protein
VPVEPSVFSLARASRCYNCDGKLAPGTIVKLDNAYQDAREREVLCQSCAGLATFSQLPAGNAQATRLAKKYSPQRYLVMRWSELWKCYERQGLLVETQAIKRIETELGIKILAVLFIALILSAFPGPNFAQSAPGSGGSADNGFQLLRPTLAVPVQVEPKPAELDVSKGQKWHRATVSLTGSVCPACLLELQHKLSVLPGVAFVSIKREAISALAPAAFDKEQNPKRKVPAVVIYDRQEIEWDRLEQTIKAEEYTTNDVGDKQIAPGN